MSQFRNNNNRSLLSLIATFFYRRVVGECGKGVNFDSIVYLMRYPKNIKLKDFSYIKGGARLCPCNDSAYITVGENTTIGYDVKIFSSLGITIGDDCMIAPNVYIVDSDHGMDKRLKMNQQDNLSAKILIGDDVWIATGAVVLKGSVIADGCVIAANSVVKGKLEPYSIYGGIPAKKIGKRS